MTCTDDGMGCRVDGITATCRYNENVGFFEISPTDRADPKHPTREAISMDIKSAAFGTRVIDFKIQFVPPCFIRYYIPSPMARPPCSAMP